jgi:hypothetical protein
MEVSERFQEPVVEQPRTCETAGVRLSGVRLSLIAASRCVSRLLHLAGLDGFFDVRPASSP